jgi:hypothetical protein
MGAPYNRNAAASAAEVEGNSRSKAQLIVGIDFVGCPFFHSVDSVGVCWVKC